MIIIKIMDFYNMSDEAILAEIGRRLRRGRLNNNLTRASLAEQIDLSQDTIRNAENGRNVSMESLIRILRGLHRLEQLNELAVDRGPSPIELAKRRGQMRQRASGKRAKDRKRDWQW